MTDIDISKCASNEVNLQAEIFDVVACIAYKNDNSCWQTTSLSPILHLKMIRYEFRQLRQSQLYTRKTPVIRAWKERIA